MSIEELWLPMLVIFIGAYVQTAIGFGLAIIAAPVLIILDPQWVPLPIIISAFTVALLGAVRHRRSIKIGQLKMALLGRVPGSLLGAGLLVWVSSSVLSMWVGVLVLVAVLVSLMPIRYEPTPRRMAVAGFFSGLFGTSSAIGGPPMALLLQHQEAHSLRANLSAFFIASSLISIAVLVVLGHVTWSHIYMSVPLIPATMAGFFLAIKTTEHLPKQTVRYSALLLCSVSGSVAIYESLFVMK
ncbi:MULTISPECIES: sulfite exporter TauE/SafE family protein [unclassified Vibrio]|uniref:Probable membrane transporter protein n=1 Tax=Vibrio sp. HB236076 TaxID=3232307 RepID=A0AB39HKG0_9VIBR|nr:sulfite exporter TauE/SafE family protein [Vibrio sp. HB161653]MDP5253058.1 sulfite exporter TauE/SafE family protein [Vibrio sp. HB161653]